MKEFFELNERKILKERKRETLKFWKDFDDFLQQVCDIF